MIESALVLDLDGLSAQRRDEIRAAAAGVAPELRVSDASSRSQLSLNAEVVSALAGSLSALVNATAVVLQVLHARRAAGESKDDARAHLEAEMRARLPVVPPEAQSLIDAALADGLASACWRLDRDGVAYEVEVRRADEHHFLVGRLPR